MALFWNDILRNFINNRLFHNRLLQMILLRNRLLNITSKLLTTPLILSALANRLLYRFFNHSTAWISFLILWMRWETLENIWWQRLCYMFWLEITWIIIDCILTTRLNQDLFFDFIFWTLFASSSFCLFGRYFLLVAGCSSTEYLLTLSKLLLLISSLLSWFLLSKAMLFCK